MTSIGSLPALARSLGCFLADERGATAIEYGLMAALISVTIMGIVFSTGQAIKSTLYDAINNALASQ